MAVFLTATLVVSCAGMVAILWLKRYELSTGKVFFAGVRPELRTFFSRGLFWLEHALPALAAAWTRRAWVEARALARVALAHAAVEVDRLLERALRALRHKTLAPHGEASPFLREVAEHKKKLLEEREGQ
jgi:hypothetical protein